MVHDLAEADGAAASSEPVAIAALHASAFARKPETISPRRREGF